MQNEIIIHKSREMEDIYQKVQKWLEESQGYNAEKQQFKLMYKN